MEFLSTSATWWTPWGTMATRYSRCLSSSRLNNILAFSFLIIFLAGNRLKMILSTSGTWLTPWGTSTTRSRRCPSSFRWTTFLQCNKSFPTIFLWEIDWKCLQVLPGHDGLHGGLRQKEDVTSFFLQKKIFCILLENYLKIQFFSQHSLVQNTFYQLNFNRFSLKSFFINNYLVNLLVECHCWQPPCCSWVSKS